MFANVLRYLTRRTRSRRWSRRTLVVGPAEPVDGDSVSCTKALISYLRGQGREAYTLPTLAMFPQLSWILDGKDLHPSALELASDDLTVGSLQDAYDAVIERWRPDEIVVVDGQPERVGFDPRGVPFFTIDHHVNHGTRDDESAVVMAAPSAGAILIKRFGIYDPILVVSLLTDTFWLRHNRPAEAIEALAALRANGLTDDILIDIQSKLMVPKDPEILDVLSASEVTRRGDAVFVAVPDHRPDIHRGITAELGYFYRHLCVVRADGYVSFRTKNPALDLRPLAIRWGGGGHRDSCATRLRRTSPKILERLKREFFQMFERMEQHQLLFAGSRASTQGGDSGDLVSLS